MRLRTTNAELPSLHLIVCLRNWTTLRKTFSVTHTAPYNPYREWVPLHERKRAGEPGDFLIVDEVGRTVWASEWCRAAYIETKPRAVHRRKK
jgi:hypothetical protein